VLQRSLLLVDARHLAPSKKNGRNAPISPTG
jgi:hypothetical protein